MRLCDVGQQPVGIVFLGHSRQALTNSPAQTLCKKFSRHKAGKIRAI